MNLVSVNADELPYFAQRLGPRFFSDRYTTGLWAWKVEAFPDRFYGAFEYVDDVRASNEFTRRAIAANTGERVLVLPFSDSRASSNCRFPRHQEVRITRVDRSRPSDEQSDREDSR